MLFTGTTRGVTAGIQTRQLAYEAHEPLARAELARLRDSSLRWIISGAEPVIEMMIAELPAARIVQGYGLSEFPTIATALRPEQAISHVGSAGRPLSIVELALETADGTVVREGEGEVLLRSPATMRG